MEGQRKRYKDFNEGDASKTEESGHEINTKRSTAWGTGILRVWLVEKGMSTNINNYASRDIN